MLVLITPRKALRIHFYSKLIVILYYVSINNIEVIEMLLLTGLVRYLDRC